MMLVDREDWLWISVLAIDEAKKLVTTKNKTEHKDTDKVQIKYSKNVMHGFVVRVTSKCVYVEPVPIGTKYSIEKHNVCILTVG